MLIQVDKLRGRPRRIAVDEAAEAFPVLHGLVADGVAEFEGAVHGELEAGWAGDVIEVRGSLAVTVKSACGRCLVPVVERLSVPVLLCYAPAGDGDAAPHAEEVELKDDDLGLIVYTGLEIDLRPDLEQEIVMALPQHSLCAPECRGLCPVCGGNLNQADCGCAPPVFHAGLAALKDFKPSK